MASNIRATNLNAAVDPSNSSNTIISFTRTDTSAQVQLSVPIAYTGQTTAQEVAAAVAAIKDWEAQANAIADEASGIAALNAAATGQTV
jgi:hypothetical protein